VELGELPLEGGEIGPPGVWYRSFTLMLISVWNSFFTDNLRVFFAGSWSWGVLLGELSGCLPLPKGVDIGECGLAGGECKCVPWGGSDC